MGFIFEDADLDDLEFSHLVFSGPGGTELEVFVGLLHDLFAQHVDLQEPLEDVLLLSMPKYLMAAHDFQLLLVALLYSFQELIKFFC